MVRMIIALLITAALLVTFGPVADAEEARPLKAGMPNTITLPNGRVVYDLSGDWDALIDSKAGGRWKDMVRITQKGDQFVGIKLIGGPYIGKNEEIIKGKLAQNIFKEVFVNHFFRGWIASKGEISEDGNKLIIKDQLGPHVMRSDEIVITLQRK